MHDAATMLDTLTLSDEDILRAASHVVFEGAQGLLLDQDMGHFPHVTRSHTGLRNVGVLIEAAGITSLDVHYVLRPYLTRHGAGPLPAELSGPPYADIVDHTNIPNVWQGSLRFALLNLDLLHSSIVRDMRHSQLPARIELRKKAVVTCLDQVGGEVRFVESDKETTASPEAFVLRCMNAIETGHGLASCGPTRSTCVSMDVPQHSSVFQRSQAPRRSRQPYARTSSSFTALM